MPNDAAITLTAGELEEGYCFVSWQQTLEDFVAAISAYLPGAYTVWNYGSQTPSADDRGKPWKRLNSDGSPDRDYVFFDGMWVSPHPIEPEDDEIRIWSGTLADIDFKDGGNANAVSETDGPFWRRASAYNGRTVVGVIGALPVSGTAVTVNGTGGEDEHILATDEVPDHQHVLGADAGNDEVWMRYETGINVAAFNGTKFDQREGTTTRDNNTGNTAAFITSSKMAAPVAAEPHNNMMPYIGAYFIVRTERKFYALPG